MVSYHLGYDELTEGLVMGNGIQHFAEQGDEIEES
jgi:hypothetical protein